jgi:hypothetical protein
MKRYFNRTVVDGDKEVTRTVVEKNGVATARVGGQDKPVVASGAPLEKSTKWRVK